MIQNKLSFNLSVFDNLKKISGFNKYTIRLLCSKLGICPSTPLSLLPLRKRDNFIRVITEISKNTTPISFKDQWNSVIPNLVIDNALNNFVKESKKKQISLNTIKGSCLNKGLPSRGQRTKTNAKTAKKRF